MVDTITVLDAVSGSASEVSGVAKADITDKTKLKTTLGMTRGDLMTFCDLVSEFIKQFNPNQTMPFDVVDKKDQTVGGVASDAETRCRA